MADHQYTNDEEQMEFDARDAAGCEVKYSEVHARALCYHYDGEKAGTWEVTTVPIDDHGNPVPMFGVPDPRYDEGVKVFALSTRQKHGAGKGSHKQLPIIHTHRGVDEKEVQFFLYTQTRYMKEPYFSEWRKLMQATQADTPTKAVQ